MEKPGDISPRLLSAILMGTLGAATVAASACVPTLPATCQSECAALAAVMGQPGTLANSLPGAIRVAPTSGLVTNEAGGSATFNLALGSQPASNVTIGISSSDTGEGAVAPAGITFTPSNWNVPQTLTVTGVDDAFADGDQGYTILTAPAVSADPAFAGVDPANVTVINQDNETPNVLLTQSGGATAVAEGGATDSYTVVLATQPTASVLVTITPDAQTRANGSLTAIILTFTAGACPGPGNWCTAQTVTVGAVDDALVEGAHTGTLSHLVTSADLNYLGLTPGDITVSIADNDVAYRRVFVTAATHNGGFDVDGALAGGTFGATNSDGNGVPEADNFCDTDANNPAPGTGNFQALIADGANRVASVTANAGDGQVNWVLQTAREYRRLDGATALFTSDANRIFPFGTLTNSMDINGVNYWTGLLGDWTTSTRHCGNWTLTTGGVDQGERGVDNAVDATSIGEAGGNRQCNQLYHLLCVEQ